MKEHEVESLLASLSPRPPSNALERAVAVELGEDREWMQRPPRRSRPVWLTSVTWAAAGAVAAALVMNALPQPDAGPDGTLPIATVTPSPAPVTLTRAGAVMPVTTIREVVGAQNQGIRYNEQSRLPEQHLKVLTVERQAWIDPRDGAQITLERPAEQSVILPVSFQ